MPHRRNFSLAKAMALAGLLALTGCDWVQDRFRECRDLHIDLENRGGSYQSVNMIMEEESYSDANLVPWLESRHVKVCAERGDAKRFLAGQGGQTLSTVNCVVSHSTDEFEALVVRVVWDRGLLSCENW